MLQRFTIAIILGVSLSGCVALTAGGVGAAAGAYVWVNGNLHRHYTAPFESTWDSALTALDRMGYEVVDKSHDEYEGEITAQITKNEGVQVTLERWTNAETRVTVRVGALGDKDISTAIHDEINKALY